MLLTGVSTAELYTDAYKNKHFDCMEIPENNQHWIYLGPATSYRHVPNSKYFSESSQTFFSCIIFSEIYIPRFLSVSHSPVQLWMDVARFTYMENPAKSSLIVRSYALQMKVSFPSWELPNNCETQFPVARTGWVVLDGNFVNLGFKMHKGQVYKGCPSKRVWSSTLNKSLYEETFIVQCVVNHIKLNPFQGNEMIFAPSFGLTQLAIIFIGIMLVCQSLCT